ncbi:MAG: LamG domain-containing protein, partial [Sedimentisphaerales bacterium]
NVWHHVAGTYDGNEVKLYIDGVLKATTAHSGTIGTNTYNVNIGTNSQYPERLYNGLIDDVRIYDKALSQAEIASIMAGGLGSVSNYHPLMSPADLYRVGPIVINFTDFAVFADNWLKEKLWP